VIGSVRVGQASTVWYGAVLRGDVNSISIGNVCSIGDRAVVHCAGGDPQTGEGRLATSIGNNVTVDAGATLHACKVGDECHVGSNAILMDGSEMQPHSMVGAGSVLTMGKVVKSGELWEGNPAQFVRKLTDEEKADIGERSLKMHTLSQRHADEQAKSAEEREEEVIIRDEFRDLPLKHEAPVGSE
jgi:gamma-carbonic anhydrase